MKCAKPHESVLVTVVRAGVVPGGWRGDLGGLFSVGEKVRGGCWGRCATVRVCCCGEWAGIVGLRAGQVSRGRHWRPKVAPSPFERSSRSQRFAGWANHREGEVHEFRDYAVAAVSVLVRELVGALLRVQVGSEDQQTVREVLVRLKIKEACAVVAAALGPFAVLLVALVGDHVGEVCEVAQIVIEGANQAVVRVVGQGAVQLRVEVRLHEVQGDVALSSCWWCLDVSTLENQKHSLGWLRGYAG